MYSAYNVSPSPAALGWVFAAGLVWILAQSLVSSPMHIGEKSHIRWLKQKQLRIQDFLSIWPGLADFCLANEFNNFHPVLQIHRRALFSYPLNSSFQHGKLPRSF